MDHHHFTSAKSPEPRRAPEEKLVDHSSRSSQKQIGPNGRTGGPSSRAAGQCRATKAPPSNEPRVLNGPLPPVPALAPSQGPAPFPVLDLKALICSPVQSPIQRQTQAHSLRHGYKKPALPILASLLSYSSCKLLCPLTFDLGRPLFRVQLNHTLLPPPHPQFL